MAIGYGLGIGLGRNVSVAPELHADGAVVLSGPVVTATASIILPPPSANLVLDLDMQDAASRTVVSGTPDVVSQITNRVSAVSWAEATNRPEYEAAGLNGFPCMLGNGTARIISTEAAVAAEFSNAATFTLYLVGKHSATGVLEFMFGAANSGSINDIRAFGSSGTRWRSRSVDTAGTAVSADGAVSSANTNANIWAWSSDAGQTSLYLNGTLQASWPQAQAPATLAINRCALFCRPSSTPANFLTGRIGKVLCYSTQHDAATQLAVSRWLGARWGIATA